MELHRYGYFRNNKQFFSQQDVKWLLFKITQNILLARAECLEYIPCILELEIKATKLNRYSGLFQIFLFQNKVKQTDSKVKMLLKFTLPTS